MEKHAMTPIVNPGSEDRTDPGIKSQADVSVDRGHRTGVNGLLLDFAGNVVGEAHDWQNTTESYNGGQPAFDASFPNPATGGSGPSSPLHSSSGPPSPVFPSAVPSLPEAFSYSPSLNITNSPRRKPSIDSCRPGKLAQEPQVQEPPSLSEGDFKCLGGFFKNLWSQLSKTEPKRPGKKECPDVEKQLEAQQPIIPSRIELSFEELQRMRLRKLQSKLVEYVADMYVTAKEPASDDWEFTLKEYIQAWRDYEYMTTYIWNGDTDPFVASSGDKIDHFLLQQVARKHRAKWPGPEKSDELYPPMRDGIDKFIFRDEWISICKDERINYPPRGAPPIGGTRRANILESRLRSFQMRLLMASGGAFFLIAPMWLMVMHNTTYTGLVSTSVFVFVFGVLAATYLENSMDVVSSTAAYAAVLVVFVGTSLA